MSSAIIIMLGSNIGTCITGYMASIGSGRNKLPSQLMHIFG